LTNCDPFYFWPGRRPVKVERNSNDDREDNAMHVAITGSSGLVGSALVELLTTAGHRVRRVVRGTPGAGQASWDPARGTIDAASLEDVDAVVHLAGEPIAAARWTVAQKQRIYSSRIDGTRLLCQALAGLQHPPKVLTSASAIGYYGDRGDETLNEASVAGKGFLAETARDWEAAARPAIEAGLRVVFLRFGIILSPRGGALAKMLTPFRLGVGGRIGNGRQVWSWISLDDVIGAIHHALTCKGLSGPVNVAAPNPATNLEFTKTLGRVLSRPTLFPMPLFAARLALGEMADELLFSSARVVPARLQASGYEFRHPTLAAALSDLLKK
jgi:uncharacterized protein (TIGR01777 family)